MSTTFIGLAAPLSGELPEYHLRYPLSVYNLADWKSFFSKPNRGGHRVSETHRAVGFESERKSRDGAWNGDRSISYERSLRVYQASPRGGDLLCTDDGERIILSGPCALYMRGEIQI